MIVGLTSISFAGETGYYKGGICGGIKSGTQVAPGFSWWSFNTYYSAGELTDGNGDRLDLGFDMGMAFTCQGFVWVSPYKFLGGNYSFDVFVPFGKIDLEMQGLDIHDDRFSVGDIWIEPFRLGWHYPRYDLTAGFSFIVPTGDRQIDKPALPGKDFWSFMFLAGGIYYLDEGRTWSVSPLVRYEIHSSRGDVDVRAGDDFYLEWGVSKNLKGVWEVGLAGYGQWQVTDDSGADVDWDRDVHHRVLAVGPEITYFFVGSKVFLSVRHEIEFAARDLPEGQVTVLTLSKFF
jgi:hypothetical protein